MISLHNHTHFSDGSWSVAEVLEAAAQAGLAVVGITDHFATSKIPAVMAHELEPYVNAVRSAARLYEGRMKVLVGVEIDSSPERTFFEAIDWEAVGALDYVLFEYVGDELYSGMPLWELLELRKKIACPVGLAHNDVARNFGHRGAEEMAALFSSHKIFLELNTSRAYSRLGMQFYRLWPEIFRMHVGQGGILSIGTDTHAKLYSVGDIADAEEFLASHGISEAAWYWLGPSARERKGYNREMIKEARR
ncbi:MAG: PHP domain-containing protein [Candidatus Thermoplasmatota archaeon]